MHECCSEYCQPLKPPEFPLEVLELLNIPIVRTDQLFNTTVSKPVVTKTDDFPNFGGTLSSFSFGIIPSNYVASLYPVIGALLLLSCILCAMKLSLFFRRNIPHTSSCIKRSGSIHEYDDGGMSTTGVSEILPVFLYLRPVTSESMVSTSSVSGAISEGNLSEKHRRRGGATTVSIRSSMNSSSAESSTNAACNDVQPSHSLPLSVANNIANFNSARRKSCHNNHDGMFVCNEDPKTALTESLKRTVRASPVNQNKLVAYPISYGDSFEDCYDDPSSEAFNANNYINYEMSTAVSCLINNGSVTSVLNTAANRQSPRYISC